MIYDIFIDMYRLCLHAINIVCFTALQLTLVHLLILLQVKGVKGAYLANKRMLGFLNQTMITWDNGRTWHYLSVPPTYKGKCVSDCFYVRNIRFVSYLTRGQTDIALVGVNDSFACFYQCYLWLE